MCISATRRVQITCLDVYESVLHGESRSLALVLTNISDRSSNSGIDLYLAAMNLWIAREPFCTLEAALESDIEEFDTKKLSDSNSLFELVMITRVVVAAFDTITAGGGDLRTMD